MTSMIQAATKEPGTIQFNKQISIGIIRTKSTDPMLVEFFKTVVDTIKQGGNVLVSSSLTNSIP